MLVIDIISGFVIAALTGLGVGSGGLFVIYLILAKGTEQIAAQGLNLAFFILSSGVAVTLNFIRRRKYPAALFLICVGGAVGALVGAEVSPHIPPEALRKIFGGLLIVSGIIAATQKNE